MIVTYLLKRLRLFFYNRKHGTDIRSVRASLSAAYGKEVSRSEERRVGKEGSSRWGAGA